MSHPGYKRGFRVPTLGAADSWPAPLFPQNTGADADPTHGCRSCLFEFWALKALSTHFLPRSAILHTCCRPGLAKAVSAASMSQPRNATCPPRECLLPRAPLEVCAPVLSAEAFLVACTAAASARSSSRAEKGGFLCSIPCKSGLGWALPAGLPVCVLC